MSFIDNAISAISPTWSARRAVAREREAEASAKLKGWRAIEASYKGGVPTRDTERWSQAQGFSFDSAQDRQQLASASDRAAQAYANNPVAKTLVDTECDNVIGDGLNYEPQSDDGDWNREAQDRYYEWTDNASVRGPDIHTGCELTRTIWVTSRVGGDCGWILVSRGPDSRVQIVPRENIVTPDGMYAERNVYDGIRFDAWGAPQTYYVLTHDDRGTRGFTPIPARDFVYLPHIPKAKPNQARGETCYMHAFDLLSHIDRYVDGVALAAWMGTVFGIVFKQANAAKQHSILETAHNSAGTLQKVVTLENGMVKYIGTDEEVAQVQAHQPMQNTPDFIRAMLRLAGMVFDMPLEAFARDMSTCNFASARIGLIPFYRACKIRGQGTFGPRWSRTIRWWLSREHYRAPGDPKRWRTKFPVDYWRHELRSNAWTYTDPVSEAQGDHLQMDMLTKSPQQVITERGGDVARIMEDWKQWLAVTKGFQRTHSSMTRDEAPEPTEAPPAGGRLAETEEKESGNGNGNGK